MEKEQYAKGDRVYIKSNFMGRCANVFVTLDRKADEQGMWFVDYANRSHPVHEKFFEFKAILPVPGKPRFKRGDRVLVKCPGHATFNKKGTILREDPSDTFVGELYQIRLDDGTEHRLNLGWLVALEDGPTYVKGDKVEVTTPWDQGKVVTVESYNGINDSGEFYTVRDKDGKRSGLSIQWMNDLPEAELPESKFKLGDQVYYNNGPMQHSGTVEDISDLPNDEGEYVYLVRDRNCKARWCAEVWVSSEKKEDPHWFKDQLQPGDRVKLKYNHSCGTVVGLETDPGFIERYRVKWDKTGKTYTESRRALVVLHAPRSTDDPLPAQAEIDRVDKLREPIIKQIEELQGQLTELNKIKSKLKQL